MRRHFIAGPVSGVTGSFRRRRVLFGVAVAATALALVVLFPGIASAHAVIVTSIPEPGAEVGTAPGVVALQFSEPLNERLSRATVTDPAGAVATGQTSGQTIRVLLTTNASGIYDVSWTTVSVLDGHTLHGTFQFGVGVRPRAGAETSASPHLPDLFLAGVRTTEYVVLLLAAGLLLIRVLARRRPPIEIKRLPLRPVLLVLFLAGLAVVIGEAFLAAGKPSMGALRDYLGTGLPGAARLVRLALEAIAVSAVVVLNSTVMLAVLIAGAMTALAAAGHAAAVQPRWWGITVDSVHLAGAGVWAGGILALALVRVPAGWRSPEGKALLRRFSPVAITAFLVTVAFGTVQAFQELGGIGELFTSSYGIVLLAKVLGIGVMVPLSLLAWRRFVQPRAEAAIAIVVIAAAALLAAYPLPPARVTEAEAAGPGQQAPNVFPRQDDLTMGGNAGQFLVGLTLRPALPGPNRLLVYLLPVEGRARGVAVGLSVNHSVVDTTECGAHCREASTRLRGGEKVAVRVRGDRGGTARFTLPRLPAPGASSFVERMQRRMHRLKTFRLSESLSSGLGVTIHGAYKFQAPNRMEITSRGNGTTHVILIGGTRYLREAPDQPWKVQRGGPSTQVPSFIWDYFKPYVAPRVLGDAAVDGVPTTIVSFFGAGTSNTPVWFKVWIDKQGFVRRAHMRAHGHFMNHRYYDFNAPFTISAPVP